MSKPYVNSWSKQNVFNQCQQKFYLLYGSKIILGKELIPFETNEYMERGNELHTLMENAGNSVKAGLPIPKTDDPRWQDWWGDWIRSVKMSFPHILVEDKIGVDEDSQGWELGEWWRPIIRIDSPIRYHGKLDLMGFNTVTHPTIGVNVDWKSGQVRLPERLGQLGMYAYFMMCRWPSLEHVSSMNIFLDGSLAGVRKCLTHWTINYTRKNDFEKLKHHFWHEAEKIHQALAINKWAYAPTTVMCKWCSATKELCQHGRK